jgi:hypothetical protein
MKYKNPLDYFYVMYLNGNGEWDEESEEEILYFRLSTSEKRMFPELRGKQFYRLKFVPDSSWEHSMVIGEIV